MADPKPRRVFLGELLLLLVAVIWGGGFVAQRMGMAHIGPFTFAAIRFLLGTLSLVPLLVFTRPAKAASGRQLESVWPTAGLLCGALLFLGAIFQQMGMQQTPAGKAGMITSMYIMFVPLFAISFGKRPRKLIRLGIVMGLVGLYFLTVSQGVIRPGDLSVAVSSVFWALHILAVGYYSTRVDPLRLSMAQFLITGVLCALLALLTEETNYIDIMAATGPILYAGLAVVGLSYTLQVLGQKIVHTESASLILSLESVFAVLFGALYLGERFNTQEWIGVIVMLAAVFIVQLASPHDDTNDLTDPPLPHF